MTTKAPANACLWAVVTRVDCFACGEKGRLIVALVQVPRGGCTGRVHSHLQMWSGANPAQVREHAARSWTSCSRAPRPAASR